MFIIITPIFGGTSVIFQIYISIFIIWFKPPSNSGRQKLLCLFSTCRNQGSGELTNLFKAKWLKPETLAPWDFGVWVPECRLSSSLSPPHRDDRPSAVKLPGSCPGTSPLEGALTVFTLLIQNLTFLRALLPWVPESTSSLPRLPSPLGQGSLSTGPLPPPSSSLPWPSQLLITVHHLFSAMRGFFLPEHEGALPYTLWPCGWRGKLGHAEFQSVGSGLRSPRPECTGKPKVRVSPEGRLMLCPLGTAQCLQSEPSWLLSTAI